MRRLLRCLRIGGMLAACLATGLLARPLRVCDSQARPANLNPFLVFEWKVYSMIAHVFDGLLGFDPEGRLLPRLARAWHWVEPTRLRLELRRGVRFHGGESFDAHTVRWNFAEMRRLGPRCARGAIFRHVKRVEVVDEDTADLVLSRPDGTLLHRLAALSWMLPRREVERVGHEEFGLAPRGTGPFRFQEWGEDGELVMDAHPGYWGGPPALEDGIVWHFLSEEEQAARMLAGELDLLGDVEPRSHRKLQESAHAEVLKADTLVQVNAVFNTRVGPASDVRVRRAVYHALEIDDLIRYVARGNGTPVPGTTMPGQVGHGESRTGSPGDPSSRFAPARARRLVREAAGPESDRVRLRGLLDTRFLILGRAMRAQLAKAGIDLELRTATRFELWQQVVEPKMQGRVPDAGDMFVFACPDPMYHYYFIHYLTNAAEGPFGMWDDEEYERLFGRMVSERDPQRMRALCREMDAIVARERPVLYLYQVKKGYGVGPGLHFLPTRSGMLDLRFSRLEEDDGPDGAETAGAGAGADPADGPEGGGAP